MSWEKHPLHSLVHWSAFLMVALLASMHIVAVGNNIYKAQVGVSAYAAVTRDSRPPIPEQYIVVFKDGVTGIGEKARDLVASSGGEVLFTYTKALKGFAARLPAQAAEALKHNPEVTLVEQDQYVSVDDVGPAYNYGSDRLDQRSLPLDNKFAYNSDGSGVNIYVIDTGVRITHQDLAGRAYYAFTSIYDGNGASDCHGHGTHVSGIAAGTKFGVAKKANIYSVRTIDCTGYGTDSQLIAGLDWVAQNHVSPAVANMSVIAPLSAAINQATENTIASGVVIAAAAGNNVFQDACNYSPASVPSVLTVGASTDQDQIATFSNIGSCVDVYALGMNIWSDWKTSDTAEYQMSGTSMATPVVSGLAAQYLAENRSATQVAVNQAIVSNATPVQTDGWGNILLPYDLFMPVLQPVISSDVTAPTKPTGLSGSAIDPNHFKLAWNASSDDTGVVGYKIYRNGALLTEVSGTSFVDTTMIGSTQNTYAVSAVDAAGNTSAQSDPAGQLAIVSYSVSVDSSTQATARVASNFPTTAYINYFVRGGNKSTVSDSTLSTSHVIKITGLTRNTSYTYELGVVDANGGKATVTGSFRTSQK